MKAFWLKHKDKILGAIVGILLGHLGLSTGATTKLFGIFGIAPPVATATK